MNKERNYLLGMDCGTTNIKAVILSEDGAVIAKAGRTSSTIIPFSGGQEQNADNWWEDAVYVFQEM